MLKGYHGLHDYIVHIHAILLVQTEGKALSSIFAGDRLLVLILLLPPPPTPPFMPPC